MGVNGRGLVLLVRVETLAGIGLIHEDFGHIGLIVADHGSVHKSLIGQVRQDGLDLFEGDILALFTVFVQNCDLIDPKLA